MDPERWRRVQALLQDAMAVPAAERAAFLARVSPSPEERREVESLLAHHREGDAFLEEGPGRLAATLFATDRLEPGRAVGAYRIVRELGRGGMGVVYLALDTRLDREVAIKMLPQEAAADDSRRERLRREARAAAAVAHPGVARIYALEEDDQGHVFVVSEYVEGRTLRAQIDEGPMPAATAVDTALQMADAIAAAHARGIVHRDLKPENVIRASDGTVKILDFGLARLSIGEADPALARLTAANAVVGTPAYMSPEQLRAADVGPATDVFALGLMLHEMLAGVHPFAAGDSSATGIMARILERPPMPLPDAVVAALPGIDGVVARCLRKDPAARYASMAALASALAALDGASGLEPSPSPAPRAGVRPVARWWWQFHQAAVCLLYVAMIYPVWRLRGGPLPAWLHSPLLLLVIGAAAVAATARLHQVFTARVHPEQLPAARRRAHPWIRSADWAMVALLLGATAAALLRDAVWMAAIFATVAASATAAFRLIEPATAEAAFGPDPP